jgi:hypothetical protein
MEKKKKATKKDMEKRIQNLEIQVVKMTQIIQGMLMIEEENNSKIIKPGEPEMITIGNV